MDRIRKTRRPLRMRLTKLMNESEAELTTENPDEVILRTKLTRMDNITEDLREMDQQMLDLMLDLDVPQEEYDDENDTIQDYLEKQESIKVRIKRILQPEVRPGSPTGSAYSTAASETTTKVKKNYKLPKIQIKKFNGEITEWLSFWSQFQKIHEDEDLHISDKFQYLAQSMVNGTRAKKIVESYPQSDENYSKVIAALKSRFGDKVLLTEVYVRKLLNLVITNARQESSSASLVSMYDELESHLRALESLGVTTAQNAVFLYPMVESSLPIKILEAWQRSPSSGYEDEEKETSMNERLIALMTFLKREVKGAERLSYVTAGLGEVTKEKVPIKREKFTANIKSRMKNNQKEEEDLPTVAGLFSGEKLNCIFCDKSHESKECFKATEMSLESKRKVVREKNCCFLCLVPGHRIDKCKAFVKCIVCKKKHPAIMCPDIPAHQKPEDKAEKTKTENLKSLSQVNTANVNCVQSSRSILMTLKVEIKGDPENKARRILFDTGAELDYISSNVVNELKLLPCGTEKLCHEVFGGFKTPVEAHRKFKLQLGKMEGKQYTEIDVLEKEKLTGKIPHVRRGPWLAELKTLGIWFNDFEDESENNTGNIDILIGSGTFWRLKTGREHKLQNGLTAVETILGWTICGKSSDCKSREESSLAMPVSSLFVSQASIEQLWDLETIGIRDPNINKSCDEIVKIHFLQTVTREENGRYEVSLPWIDGQQDIPSNRFIAEKRLSNAVRKLKAGNKFGEYEKIFSDWLNEDLIEEVPKCELDKPCHYLPHRPVFKPQSRTTPVRPVFDASCKIGRNASLNDCLYKGPNLLDTIPSHLLRFREKKIGSVSDIRKAFQMILISKRDRDYLRFLWWEESTGDYRVLRHKRVVFGINCSPYLLGAVLEFHLKSVTGELAPIAEKLLQSLYVDNCVTSMNTMEEYEEFKFHATKIMADAKMELRDWQCNSVVEPGIGPLTSSGCRLGTSRVATEVSTKTEMVLGLIWDKETDTLCSDVSQVEIGDKITKRSILSCEQKIFDPIGILSPVLLLPKKILQDAWALKTSWDEELTEDLKSRFGKWIEEIPILSQIEIPRNITEVIDRNFWELHTYCDASAIAYATVVFLRTRNEESVSVRFLMAKSRVAPIKKMSIPRLELMSCTIGVRLTDFVKKSLSFENVPTFYWSDSSTALSWIKRNDEWGTFVGNRVREILKFSSAEEWRHVPGIFNPADLPSRGCSPKQLLKSKWWNGPQWLKMSIENWPRKDFIVNEDEIASERKKTVKITVATSNGKPWYILRASYYENVRIVAYVKRFVNLCKRKKNECKFLTVNEIKAAEEHLLKLVQKETLTVEGDRIMGINVIRDEIGVTRVKTKLLYREDTFGFRYPILLPNSHPLVDLLIEETHRTHGHSGVQFLMGKLRENYWIIQGRIAIRRIIKKCVNCRRFSLKKAETEQAPLPADRVKTAKAFEVAGVDLAGPLQLKDKTKVWILLVTCAVYRCVHLEVIDSLSTEAFLESFTKFTDRRGRPSIVYSDNGTNFVGAVNIFKTIDWEKVTRESGLKQIQWRFNPPSAAWWGGWWERLVRSTKDQLRRILGKGKLTHRKLENVLTGVEAFINGRPLTTVTEDGDDLIPLTPSMFLTEIPARGVTDLDVIDSNLLQTLYRERKTVLDEFKMRFRKEYLAMLVQRKKGKDAVEPRVNDIVLIGSDNKKRWEWPMGRITEVIRSRDGYVRVVRIQTATGNFLRPIQRVYNLEVPTSCEILGSVKKSEAYEEMLQKVERKVRAKNAPNVTTPEAIVPEVVTRSGRKVKQPEWFRN